MGVILFFIGIGLLMTVIAVSIDRRERRSRSEDFHQQMVRRSPWRPTLAALVTTYGLYGLIIALSGVVFFTWPTTIAALLGALAGANRANRAVYMFAMVGLGLLLLVGAMVAEPYLRNSQDQRQRLRRFVGIALLLSGAAILGLLLRLWAQMSLASS